MEYIVYDNPQIYPQVEDLVVWDALIALSGADLPSTDRQYLYEIEDFQQWLDVLNSAP
jgi:hypothetical protein